MSVRSETFRHVRLAVCAAAALGLAGCPQGGRADGSKGSKCSSDSDCKNGLLCESAVCIPTEAAEKIRGGGPKKATDLIPTATAATAAPATAPVATADPLAATPDTRSKVPTLQEWNAVGECNVRHSSSLGCETKMVREWLRVSCRTAKGDNQIKGLKVVEVKGTTSAEVFEYTNEGVASVVMPVRSGLDAKVLFFWSEWGTRTLRVQHPHGAPEPVMEFDRAAPSGPRGRFKD